MKGTRGSREHLAEDIREDFTLEATFQLKSWRGKEVVGRVAGKENICKGVQVGERRASLRYSFVRLPAARRRAGGQAGDNKRAPSWPGWSWGANQSGGRQSVSNDTVTFHQSSCHFPSPARSAWLTRIWPKATVPLTLPLPSERQQHQREK